MKRILIIGHPGAGKSTFAVKLGEVLKLPVVHLDKEFWNPDWQPTRRDVWRQRVESLVSSDTWIIDGSYDSTLDIRLPRADTVIVLNFSRYLCFWRLLKRTLTNFRGVRPDMADGCPEKLDPVFIKFVWNYQRDHVPKIEECLRKYFADGKQIVLKSPASAR